MRYRRWYHGSDKPVKPKGATMTRRQNPSGQYVVELRSTHQYWKSGKFVKNLSDATKYKNEVAANRAIGTLLKKYAKPWGLDADDLMTVKINPSKRKSTVKKRRTPAQIAATKKLVAYNKKKRPSKKRTKRNPSRAAKQRDLFHRA